MLETTIIGSMPTAIDSTFFAKNYLANNIQNAFPELIKQAVGIQLDAGIDIVSDGQTRADFVKLFVTGFRGAVVEARPTVLEKISYTRPITVDDQKYVRTVVGDKKKIKGIVTGPYTLAKNCVNEGYNTVEDLAFDFAAGLRQEVKSLCDIVDYIQVDEPMMTVDYPEYAKDLITEVFKDASKTTMMHACGDVSGVFQKFIEFPVDVLEHEFAANPELLDVVSKFDFKQKIGYGSVRSDSAVVESVKSIVLHIEAGLKKLDADNLFICPDCGLRNHTIPVALQKLTNMVEARDQVVKKWEK